jgi:hypothetical protein
VTIHRVSRVVYDPAALDWTPLERFLAAATQRGVPAPDADDFMWMGRCELHDGPVVHLFKHAASRRYLNLDYAGFSYRYHVIDDTGHYEPFESPLAALEHVTAELERDAARIVAQWSAPTRASPGPSLTT